MSRTPRRAVVCVLIGAALDARTGRPLDGFGDGGYVDLSRDIDKPGALVTKTLLFMGEGGGVRGGVASLFGAGGPIFRAYEKRTGEVLAEITLPANPTGGPMSYLLDGRQ